MSCYVGITREKSDQLLRGMVERGVLEPVVLTSSPREFESGSSDDYELSVHEAAHAALTFAAGDEVVSIRLAARIDQAGPSTPPAPWLVRFSPCSWLQPWRPRSLGDIGPILDPTRLLRHKSLILLARPMGLEPMLPP